VASPAEVSGAEIIHPVITIENPIHEAPLVEYYKPEIPSDLEFILDHRPIALRNRVLQAVFKIQAEIAHAYRLYMHDTVHASEYFAPNIIGTSSEGGAEFFNVDYFGYTATLAQSSQLYKQIMVGVNERVFALMPFFRAEPSQTSRHLSEGKQFEFEIGFFNNWHEILDIQEGCIKFILAYLHRHCAPEIAILGGKIIQAPQDVPFPRLTFQEAQELYFQRTGIDERNEPDLSPAAEKALCAWALEKHGTELVFVTDWKTEKRPFYAYPTPENPTLTNTFDLLCAGTEITSGGQRRHTYESMVEGIRMKGMDPANFPDYLSIFKYGMPPHGGFGMGLERLTMTLLKLKNIREASLFPSDPKRIAGNRIKAHIFFGGENIRNEILRLCHKHGLTIQHSVHEPTPTSEDSSRVRGIRMEEGIKALILRGKNSKKNYQFNIPANRKLDMKAAAEMVGEKCEFEDPAVILERFGLKIGGVPPFGNLIHLDNYFDEAIRQEPRAAFNCGLLTESIIMPSKDLATITDPKWGHFSKL
jgi:nondiscriminating aspartyl-tRNA synthetase